MTGRGAVTVAARAMALLGVCVVLAACASTPTASGAEAADIERAATVHI